MPSEKETALLKSYDYEIDGNSLSAFYDKHGKLVFVLDTTVNKFKPNVLLVMTSHGDRKWDDVLSNDYGMDLELVRPRKDNKYQKLDIEYDGLVVYDNLIRAYQDGGNLKDALKDLNDFRAMSVRRSATERLEVATAIAENARATIERTGNNIVDLQAKIKSVRTKITTLRRNVGKEPTKQSAAKILKAEAQLDVLKSKLERAEKRLENANRRLLVAEEDIAAARRVLDLISPTDKKTKFKTVETAPIVKPVKNRAPELKEPDDEPDNQDFDDDLWNDDFDDDDDAADDEQESDDKDDTDVKPLFDKDPNILDENIAFKPISFDEKPVSREVKEKVVEQSSTKEEIKEEIKEEDTASFAPPKPVMDIVQVPGYNDDTSDVKLDSVFSEDISDEIKYDDTPREQEHVDDAPVLDSLKSVDETEVVKSDVPEVDNSDDVSAIENNINFVAPMESDEMSSTEEVHDVEDKDVNVVEQPEIVPVPEQPVEEITRPVTAPVRPPYVMANPPRVEAQSHKPNILYYVLLLVLIGLSVFTLWLYQRSNVSGDAVPDLGVDNPVEVVQPKPEVIEISGPADESPFVAGIQESGPAEKVTIETVVEKSLDKIAKAADIKPVEPVNEYSDQDAGADTDVDADVFVPTVEPVVQEPPKVQEPIVVNKPEYDVSQDKVFVKEIPAGDIEDYNLCSNNAAPDEHGCCPGEVYTDMGDAGFNCCPDGGGDCFPPMF